MSHSFEAFEGQYISSTRHSTLYKDPQSVNIPVHISFCNDLRSFTSNNCDAQADHPYVSEWNMGDLYCMNIGKELIIHTKDNQHIPVDRRVFKSPPTCHSFKVDSSGCFLLVGLFNGELHVLVPTRKEISKMFNEEKLIDKSPVTCVDWVAGSPTQFLAGHASGCLYLYDENLPAVTSSPSYEPFKAGYGFSVQTCKAKSTRNPLYRWKFGTQATTQGTSKSIISQPSTDNDTRSKTDADDRGHSVLFSYLQSANEDNAAINQFAFSPCGTYLAIVTQDGYLRVMDYHSMNLYGYMKSYFAGLLCVDWSPDGRFIVVGGQDDLISIWSMANRSVICRGQGHRSWISAVRFDPFLCPQPESINGSSRSISGSGKNDATITSVQLASAAPTASHPDLSTPFLSTYRIGSVGQDTMFCLWELTGDVIRQGTVFVQEYLPHLPSDRAKKNEMINSTAQSSSNSTTSSDLSGTDANTSQAPRRSGLLKSKSHPTHHNHPRNMANLFGFFNFTRRKSHAQADLDFHSVRLPSSHGLNKRRTLDNGPGVNMTSDSGLSSRTLPNGTKLSNGSSLSRLPDYFISQFLGTPICPRYNDVPVLEPLIATAIQDYRLTDLIFRSQFIYVVCQHGLLQIWSRPVCIDRGDYSSTSSNDEPDNKACPSSRQLYGPNGVADRESPSPVCQSTLSAGSFASSPVSIRNAPTSQLTSPYSNICP